MKKVHHPPTTLFYRLVLTVLNALIGKKVNTTPFCFNLRQKVVLFKLTKKYDQKANQNYILNRFTIFILLNFMNNKSEDVYPLILYLLAQGHYYEIMYRQQILLT